MLSLFCNSSKARHTSRSPLKSAIVCAATAGEPKTLHILPGQQHIIVRPRLHRAPTRLKANSPHIVAISSSSPMSPSGSLAMAVKSHNKPAFAK